MSYNKRCDFNFPIIKHPNLQGSNPVNVEFYITINLFFYNSFNVIDWADVKLLILKLLKEGFLQTNW